MPKSIRGPEYSNEFTRLKFVPCEYLDANGEGRRRVNVTINQNEPPRGHLVFNGVAIRDKGEMMCLTDMWKAVGSLDSKRPANWARNERGDFIEHVSMILDVSVGHVQAKKGGRCVGGSTYAHWQIAIAYAKYLSPEFHMCCNSVVREAAE